MVNYETIKCHACSKSLDVGTAIYMRFDKPRFNKQWETANNNHIGTTNILAKAHLEIILVNYFSTTTKNGHTA